MEIVGKYTQQEKRLDNYLGTNNLRPGPPRKLIHRMNEIEIDKKHNTKKDINIQTSEKAKKNINFFSYSREIKKDIKWEELISVKKSSTGSGGVFFLEFLQNTALVLKSSVDIPYLCLGSVLKKACGIDSPSMRVIEYDDPEFSRLIESMEKVSVQDHRIYNEVKNSLAESVFLIVFEYVPNLSLIELGPNRSQIFLTGTHSQSRKLFLEIGRIIAFDILVNNFDRLPFAWSNHGNIDNLLFKINLDLLTPNVNFKDMSFLDIYIESVVAIDTKPICLDPQDRVALKNLGDYLNRLSETFKLFFNEMKNIMLIGKSVETFEFRSMDKIQILFKDSCNYQLQGINMFHIGEGLIIMMKDIVEIDLSDISLVIDIVKHKIIKRDWADVYKSNTKNMNMEYFKYILNFLKQVKEENEDIFTWVQDITLGMYGCEFKKNLKEIIDFEQKMRFEPESMVTDTKSSVEKKIDKNEFEENKENEYDVINYKKEDKIKIKNDVHNGVFDIMPLDEDMVLDRRKKEFKKIEIKKMPVSNLRPKKIEPVNTDILDPHKKYTMEELKEKIKKDELKDTLRVKQKFNPNEARYLEEKIIASGNEELLREDENKIKNDKSSRNSSLNKSPTKNVKKSKIIKSEEDYEDEDDPKLKKSKTKNGSKRKKINNEDDEQEEEVTNKNKKIIKNESNIEPSKKGKTNKSLSKEKSSIDEENKSKTKKTQNSKKRSNDDE